MSRTRRIAAVAVALVVMAAGLVLRAETARREATGAASSCRVSDTLDCDAVQASRYARVAGVSLSTLGAAAHLVLALWVALAAGGTLLVAAGALAAVNLLAAAGTAVLSWVVLGKVCLYCTAMQAGIVALAFLVVPPALRALRGGLDRPGALKAGLIGCAVGAVFLAGDAYAEHRAALVRLFERPAGEAVRLDVSECIVVGDPATDVSLLMFFDFGCPHCKKIVRETVREVQERPGAAHLILKHYPLERLCNPALDSTKHPASCAAAAAGQAAAMLGHADRALEFLFDKQERGYGFGPMVLRELGPRVGVDDADEWRRRMEAPEVSDIVQRDIAEGNALRLHEVPTAYLNGRSIDPHQAAVHIRKLAEAK